MALALGLTVHKSGLLLSKTNHLTHIIQPARQLKSALKIKWVRPEKVSGISPEMSGDLKPLGEIDTTQFPSSYKVSKELQSADEIVQRIHTLDFFNRDKVKEEYLIQYTERVKAHQLDTTSPEVKIAVMTSKIRNLQIHIDKFPQDKVNKVILKELIDKRNRRLTELRRTDYKKFEWLLDKLDLEYKVYGLNGHERVERKRSVRRLTVLYIEKLKLERLTEYKALLESQKEEFFMNKLEKLLWMKKVEEDCGVPTTVSESDIEVVKKQLQELQLNKPKEVVVE